MSARWTPIVAAGLATVLAGPITAQFSHYGSGCAGASGTVPSISTPAHPFTGQEYYLDVNAPAITAGLLIVGIDNTSWGALPLPYDLSTVGLFGCELLVRPNLMLPFTTDSNGDYRFAAPGLPLGSKTYAQVYASDLDIPSGIIGGMSDGLEVTAAGPHQLGDLIINEIMVNPEFTATDMDGEWFEVKNRTPYPINMEGWVIESSQGLLNPESHVIDTQGAGLIVPPNGYAVLSLGPEATNGGVPTDYVYGAGIRFKNNGIDNLRLLAKDQTLIDSVEWDDGVTFPDPKGASMNLNFFHDDPTVNDLGKWWCASKSAIGGSQGNTDLGTPAAPNAVCL
jgi:hypothetical protein